MATVSSAGLTVMAVTAPTLGMGPAMEVSNFTCCGDKCCCKQRHDKVNSVFEERQYEDTLSTCESCQFVVSTLHFIPSHAERNVPPWPS